MGERERILELVKDGIITVNEGLDLLESLANKETEETEQREFTTDGPIDETIFEKEERVIDEPEVKIEPETEPTEPKTEEPTDEMKAEDKETMKQYEDELENLANEMTRYSVEIDAINEELTQLKSDLADAEDTLQDRKVTFNDDYSEARKELEADIINLKKEIDLITIIEEIDSTEEVAGLNKELTQAMEELQALENQATDDEEIQALEEKVAALRKEVHAQTEVKNERLKELHSLKMKQWSTKAKRASENLDIPEEWREGANKTFNKAGDIFEETSKTISDVFKQTMKSTKEALGNIDWKDMNFNLAKGEKETFNHEWLFEDTTATILEFKNANGDIHYKPSVNDNIKVTANVEIRGDIDGQAPLEAFEASSIIKIDEDKFTFHVPNKKITANMIVYLPQRDYDYIGTNTFNGDTTFTDLRARDLYVKSTNGDILLDQIEASMVEIKGTNGDITLKDARLRDLLINTVNGDIRVVGHVQSSDLGTTNGDIRLSLNGDDLIRVAGNSVNGHVKVSLPEEAGLEIDARSTFGKVKSRLSNTMTSNEDSIKGKAKRYQRIGQGEICRVNLQTTTGNILLKDTDK